MFLFCIELPFQTMLLAMEAHAVIGLRMKRIADGGSPAVIEASQMIVEKIAAFTEAAGTLMAGGSVQTVVSRYRTHVQANEARLLAPVRGA